MQLKYKVHQAQAGESASLQPVTVHVWILGKIRKQGHGVRFTLLFEQVGCLSFVSALFELASCQSPSRGMWHRGTGGRDDSQK